jgi:hypothetical protein
MGQEHRNSWGGPLHVRFERQNLHPHNQPHPKKSHPSPSTLLNSTQKGLASTPSTSSRASSTQRKRRTPCRRARAASTLWCVSSAKAHPAHLKWLNAHPKTPHPQANELDHTNGTGALPGAPQNHRTPRPNPRPPPTPMVQIDTILTPLCPSRTSWTATFRRFRCV